MVDRALGNARWQVIVITAMDKYWSDRRFVVVVVVVVVSLVLAMVRDMREGP